MPTARALTPFIAVRHLLQAVAYLLPVVSCDDPLSPGGQSVARIEVSPPALALDVGATRTITARVLDASGARVSDSRVFWSTENPTIATVSQSGDVHGVAPGATRIAASSRGKSAIVPVTVSPLRTSLVRVVPSHIVLRVGSSLALRAEAINSAGEVVVGRPVIWTSSDETRATVTSAGLVTGVSPGTASISASVDGVSGEAPVTVEAVPVASVSVSPGTGELLVGQTLQLTATTFDSAGSPLTGRDITWASNAPAIATVSSSGMVIALSAGNATITASSEGISGASRITVSLVPVSAVEIAPSTATLSVGRYAQLTARLVDATGAEIGGRPVTWVSDQPNVASVASDGKVTAIAVGSATITATSEGKSGRATINVTQVPVATLTVMPGVASIAVGTTQQFIASARDSTGTLLTGRVITWISGGPSVATVDQSGLVTAVAVGTALIIATCEDQRASVSVTVTPPSVARVSVSPGSANLSPGGSLQFVSIAFDVSGNVVTGLSTSWNSSNAAIATVSTSGLVTGVAVGSTQISATMAGVSGTASVFVSLVPVVSITLSPNPVSIPEGQSVTMTATVTDSMGNALVGRPISWSSSDVAVATVSPSGVVTAVAPGSAIITAAAPNAGVGGTTPAGTSAASVTYTDVATVHIAPPTPVVTAGSTLQLTATLESGPPVTTLAAAGRTLIWTVADPTIATISATGLVTGVLPGTTSVTLSASSPGQATPATSSAPLTVNSVQIARIALTQLSGTIHVGTLYARQVTAQAFDAANNVLSGAQISWSSSDPNRLDVAPTGLSNGIATATALNAPATGLMVVASAAGATGVVADTITTSSDLVPVSTVAVSPLSATLAPGQTLTLAASASDSAGNIIGAQAGNPLGGRSATWISANPGIGTVNALGVVTAVAAGSTTIGVTIDGVGPATFDLSVTHIPVASVNVSAPDSSLMVGDVIQATVVARDTANNVLPDTGRTIVWSSSAPTVATVSATGLITVVGAGSTTIGVTVDGVGPASFVLSAAQVPVSRVDVTPSTASLIVGDVSTFVATPRDAAGNALANRVIAWTVSNAKAAIKPPSGSSTKLTALDSGAVVLSATSEGQTGAATLSIALVPVDTVESMPGSPSPSLSISAGAGHSVQGKFRALSASGAKLAGRAFTLTTSDATLGTIAPVGTPLTNTKGEGEFKVTLTSAAVPRDVFYITVTVDGKSTTWVITVK